MSEQQLHQQSLPSLEIVKATFTKELSLLNYQSALQNLLDMDVTGDNLNPAQERVKKARGFINKMEEIHKVGKAPYWAVCKFYDAVLNDAKAPLQDALNAKDKEIQIEGKKQQDEKDRIYREKQRVSIIRSAIDSFILEQTSAIASANKNDDITRIEKLIGSHKANESRYQEFLPELVERISTLIPLIKKQKEHIKELEKVEKEQSAAKASGDDAKFLELQDKKEVLQYGLDETKVVLQETAINSAINSNAPIVAEEVSPNVKSRRKSYSFRVVDEKKAFNSGMLLCELDKEKAKLVLSGIKDNVTPNTPQIINGIEYFVEVTY